MYAKARCWGTWNIAKWAPLYWDGLIVIPTWVGNLKHSKEWDEITYLLHTTFYDGCNYLCMLGLKLINVNKRVLYSPTFVCLYCPHLSLCPPCVSYKVRKIVGCIWAENAGNVFPATPATDFKGNCYLVIPACITARASRTFRDACRGRWPAVAGKTFPAFPVHATRNFTYRSRGPCNRPPWYTYHSMDSQDEIRKKRMCQRWHGTVSKVSRL